SSHRQLTRLRALMWDSGYELKGALPRIISDGRMSNAEETRPCPTRLDQPYASYGLDAWLPQHCLSAAVRSTAGIPRTPPPPPPPPRPPPPRPPPPPPPPPARPPPAPAPPVENSPEVVELLEKHIAAIGGREALSAIQTVDTQREAEVHKALQRSHEIRDKTSGRFYSKTDGPKGPVEMGFDGKRVWQKSPFFRGYLPETDPGAKNLSRRHPELFEYKETGQKFAMLPSETVDGKQLLVLYTRSAEFDIQGHET